MIRDKIVPQLLSRIYQLPIIPVIIKAKLGKLEEVFYEVEPYLLRVGLLTYFRLHQLHLFPTRMLRRFGMLSAVLPREIVFDLAESPYVEKIYYDKMVTILQYPTVGPEGVFEMRRGFGKKIRFTSTYWTKRLIGADEANKKGFTGRGIRVAILDTGAARYHPQLRGKVYHYSVMAYTMDDNGHGSWIAACIGGDRSIDRVASRQVGKDVVCEGMAPECELYSIKCLGYVIGAGSTSGVLDAVEKAIDLGVDIISMSLGSKEEAEKPEDDPAKPVFEEALKNKIIAVVAAGNSGPNGETIATPGALDEVLTVGAYDPIKGEIAEFSSRGPTPWGTTKPDCVAPGVNIDSASVMMCDMVGDNRPNMYGILSGTSMATPHVAGLVALMRQAHRELLGKTLTVDEIKRMLRQLGHSKNNTDGWGVINWRMYEDWLSTEYSVEI